MRILEQLGKRILFFDGAMGTMLQQAGLRPGELPELWNLRHPDTVLDIHRGYLRAGCDILKTNTFGANRLKLESAGTTPAEVITAAVRLAKQAAAEYPGERYVAMDIGPTGKLLHPIGDLSFENAYAAFAEMAVAGEKAGADLILIETMSDTYEVKAAVLAAKENTHLPVFATMVFDQRGKLLTGGDIPAAVTLLEGLRVDALGINCGLGPIQVEELIDTLTACCSTPVVLNPNAGMPKSRNGETVYDVDARTFAAAMQRLVQKGAWVVGGCCGTTPAHIASTVAYCREQTPLPLPQHAFGTVSSYTHAVKLGGTPVLIGERINPTGKSRFKQALRNNELDYVLTEGLQQQKNGAHILDVNVGLPEIDEAAMMQLVVTQLQSVLDLPLQIDTSDPAVLAGALRLYNGKALINSVNGKEASMKAVFPLVRQYGGVVVALTLDENGIPPTAEGRLAVAEKILAAAASYGIPKKDLLFDPLTMAISADPGAAKITLHALALIKNKLHANTILGVSNVSFGLPQRENINAAFFSLALQNGLDAAILNPASVPMQTTYYASNALLGKDPQCAAYIARYAGRKAEALKKEETSFSLYDAITQGLKKQAALSATALVRSQDPLEIIHAQLVPALDHVGKAFEQGTLFLPQLLMSADAAKAAFDVMKTHMRGGAGISGKGKIVLATVYGDIHDIGKNIVKVLLENYGYDVVDLGKDVPVESIVETVVQQHVHLVGLSALMTTTVANMEATIHRLRAAAPACRIMVGGAVLTEEYAAMIGADFYGKDAMAAVRYAETLFS